MFRRISFCLLFPTLLAGAAVFAADADLLDEKRFDLRKDGEQTILFRVDTNGTLRVRAHVREPLASAPVRLLLRGPDGVEVEKKGSAPINLRYRVENVAQHGEWVLIVHNVGKMGRLTGTADVRFERAPEPAETAPPASSAVSASAVSASTVPAPTASRTDARPTATSAPVTDGKVLAGRRLRAACRDRNRDVEVRVDLESGSAGLYLSYNLIADLAARKVDGRIELRGDGEQALWLDPEQKVLYFAAGASGVFCKVKMYPG